MKFSCLKEHLEKFLVIAERFTGKNMSLPVLGSVLLETDDDSLLISATNLEYGMQGIVQGKVSGRGRVSVPAKIISSLIQSIKDERVDIEEKQGNVFIKTASRDIRINGTATEDFPILPRIKKDVSFSVNGGELRRGLESVLPAASTSEFKPELAGVFFKVAGRSLSMVATDTFRLARKTVVLEEKVAGENISFILPYRLGQELTRVFGEDEGTLVSLGENQVVFETKRLKIISRLVEGMFPEYTNIIPKDFETTSHISRAEFVDAIRASGLFSSKLQDVGLHFHGQKLDITSQNQEVGEYKTSLDVATSGKDLALSFNNHYLLDGLSALEDEECFFGLNESSRPSLVRDKSDESFIYVVMPIRLT